MNQAIAIVFTTLLTGAAIQAAPRQQYFLDFSRPATPIEFNGDGYWTETYNTAEKFRSIEFGDRVKFRLNHCRSGFGGDDVGGGMNYWDGFTISKTGDTRDYGALGSSSGWVSHQWGCMAGGGLVTDTEGRPFVGDDGVFTVSRESPYAVAYWNRNPDGNMIEISGEEEKSFLAKGICICAHPWPYYGIQDGDGFSRAFTEEDDYFKLIIHGLSQNGTPNGKIVEYFLATMDDPYGIGWYEPCQSDRWEWVDLSPLGEISGVSFTMESSDNNPEFGINTAAYFCLGGMEVESLIYDSTTAIDSIGKNDVTGCQWYTLDGCLIPEPSSPGIYICRSAEGVKKIRVR